MTNTIHRFSISQVSQGKHRFYTCTMYSDILAKCCFVSTRDEDPKDGFQRLLDVRRAEEIAKYIDAGLGTVPSSIILSAQSEAEMKIVGRGKTLEFVESPKAFMIIDGQHRVYGFSLAKTKLRVPVVIYNGLSRQDETKLFIDINSKQRGVPNELLLDIKQLADYESDQEELLRNIFDQFNQNHDSTLLGKMSSAEKSSGKISRVTFNNSIKPIINIFNTKPADEIYCILNNYLIAMNRGLEGLNVPETITNGIVFKAICAFFPIVASKVKDKYGQDYSTDNFYEVLVPMFMRIKPTKLEKSGTSYKAMKEYFESNLNTDFSI